MEDWEGETGAADEGQRRAWEDWSFDDLDRIDGIEDIDSDEWWGLDAHANEANTVRHGERISFPSIDSSPRDLPPRREPPRPELFRRPSPHPAPRPHHPHPTDSSRQTAPDSSDDWLDRLSTRRQEQLFDELDSFDFDSIDDPPSPSSFSSAFNINDILGEDASSADNMAPSRTTRPRNSIVDLTDPFSSPPTRRPTKRKAESSGQPSKRRKIKSEDRIKDEDSSEEKENIEELDLTNENPSAEEELLQNQQQQLLATQQAATGALKIGKRTCIICMEAYKNATVTTCGHLYCHECLTQALEAGEKNSEKGVGNCPVCRKALNRKKKAMQMIPISFMKKSAFKGKARRLAVLG